MIERTYQALASSLVAVTIAIDADAPASRKAQMRSAVRSRIASANSLPSSEAALTGRPARCAPSW